MTEHVRTLEPYVDFALADAAEFVRGDVIDWEWVRARRTGRRALD